jgi:uncharacterized coiled-coil protein SlyX
LQGILFKEELTMTFEERIKKLEERTEETKILLADLKENLAELKEKTKILLSNIEEGQEKKNEESVLAEYWNCLNSGEAVHYIDSSNEISEVLLFGAYDDNNTQGYSNYPTKEYAEQAQKIKEFNDKLLAFKWCYDRDYKPVFSGDYDNRAYYIYYDSEYKEYDYDWDSTCDENIIYFSSKEIAQKCCDWLNAEMEEE